MNTQKELNTMREEYEAAVKDFKLGIVAGEFQNGLKDNILHRSIKQHISVKQLNELSDKGKDKLRKWCKKHNYLFWLHANHETDQDLWCYSDMKSVDRENLKEYTTPLLSIGQMLEFLGGDLHKIINEGDCWAIEIWHKKTIRARNYELADALWGLCTEVLNGRD